MDWPTGEIPKAVFCDDTVFGPILSARKGGNLPECFRSSLFVVVAFRLAELLRDDPITAVAIKSDLIWPIQQLHKRVGCPRLIGHPKPASQHNEAVP